ncbi:MAG: prolyl-tRNA synthetase associated domain-containing protein [Oscillospiraceae bacterium]|nr:prolyl-tRNA synthetase associated domain-containing protein [Oscillospiraceae bacterium]
MKLELGRPADCSARLPKEQRVYEFLDGLNIEYGRVDHAPAMTMEDCAAIDEVLDAVTCKNLLLTNKQQTAFYLLLMPGEKPFKTKYLSAQIGSARLSFASAEKMEELLDITPGSLSVLGLINDSEKAVTLLADEDVLNGDYIGFHPCINTSSLRLSMKDLLEIIIPAMGHPLQTVNLPWEVE